MESEAATWAARIDARAGEPLPELDAWLAEDPRHTGALLRAQSILALLSEDSDVLREADEPAPPARSIRRWLLAGGGAIAAMAAAVTLFLAMPRPPAIYETGAGEVQQIALADGSAMAIDARSRLAVDFDGDARRITMSNGRAIFRAAKGDDRPFQVVVGAITITDIGTEFQVYNDPASKLIEVLVTEGEVQIDGPGLRLNLVAGQTIRVAPTGGRPIGSGSQSLSTRDILRTTAWREGRLELDGDTLAEAVAQLNRANQVQIVIADPGLAGQELHGEFRMSDPRGFAQAVAVSLNTTFAEQNGTITLGR
ncbi:FecR family protein [Erythrobacter sp. HL-111]|uniref:FecR family protein n=1 Tax=Erythrobacter sp. HL-111 TaxID=1798193 RepID=UPI0006D99E2C|nr:FecR domain-containing protein [Erythrobacter sp. HL-111]KPP94452.1 MAG: transmembrane sensor [Erythrobacteraceae bacterium HL-111]SDS57782.1 FecR family protein [Erythrobacter sp. HL-111]